MKILIDLNLEPFPVPIFVRILNVVNQDEKRITYSNRGSLPLRELSPEALGLLCDEFRVNCFKKVGLRDELDFINCAECGAEYSRESDHGKEIFSHADHLCLDCRSVSTGGHEVGCCVCNLRFLESSNHGRNINKRDPPHCLTCEPKSS